MWVLLVGCGLVWFCGAGVVGLLVVLAGVVPIGARTGGVRASPARCGVLFIEAA